MDEEDPNFTDSIILPGSNYIKKHILQEIKNNKQCSLEYISSKTHTGTGDIQIPILFYKHQDANCDLYTLYFHGNGENIVEQMYFYEELTKYFKTNIVAMEYSGYALYESHIVDSLQIKADAVTSFDYLVNKKGISAQKILIFGRSIGSGPACYLGSQRQGAGIIIFSGFSRIVTWLREKKVTKELEERFDNLDCVKSFKSPTLVIHGVHDHVIDVSHAKTLSTELAERLIPYKQHLDEEMQHNYYSFEKLAEYITTFITEQGIGK